MSCFPRGGTGRRASVANDVADGVELAALRVPLLPCRRSVAREPNLPCVALHPWPVRSLDLACFFFFLPQWGKRIGHPAGVESSSEKEIHDAAYQGCKATPGNHRAPRWGEKSEGDHFDLAGLGRLLRRRVRVFIC